MILSKGFSGRETSLHEPMQFLHTRDEARAIQGLQVKGRVISELHPVVGQILQIPEGGDIPRILIRHQRQE